MNSKQWASALLSLGIALLGIVPAVAAEGGRWYVGVSAGESTFNHGVNDFNDGSLASGSVDGKDAGWKTPGSVASFRFRGHRNVRHGRLRQ